MHRCLSVHGSRPGWTSATAIVGTVDDTHTRCPCLFASASFWCDSTRDFPNQEEDREKQDHDGEVWVTLIFFKAKGTQTFFSQRSHLER